MLKEELKSINSTLSIIIEIEKLCVEETAAALVLSDTVVGIRQEEFSKLPFHINVIESAARGRLRETGHSRILVDLLQHPALQKSFTKLFLGVDLPFLQVDREIGNYESHIDVALYDDKHFVIVENKVNDAVEQEHQVYRYVHEIGVNLRGKDIENIWVIYLNPSGNNLPSLQTLCNGDPDTDVRKLLKDRFVVKSFATDIIDWLQNTTLPEEPFLQSAIHQYIDYLQRFFETTDDYKNMKEKVDKVINEHIGIDHSMTATERVKLLKDQLDSLNILKENIERMIADANYEIAISKLSELFSEFKSIYPDFVTYDNLDANPANFGIGVPYKDEYCVNVHLEIGSSGQMYYGVICDWNKYPEAYQKTREMLADYFQDRHNRLRNADNVWPIWEYTDINVCKDDVTMLIEKIRSLFRQQH